MFAYQTSFYCPNAAPCIFLRDSAVLGLAFLLVHCATGTFQDLNCDWDDLLDDQRHNLGKNVWVQLKDAYNHMDGVCVGSN